jgi:hypothetical protein
VHITSLGYRTDLALLRLGGSEIEDRGDHVVVRSPHNPTHWWGNFLLLPGPPRAAETDHWLATFHAEFPDAKHWRSASTASTVRRPSWRRSPSGA